MLATLEALLLLGMARMMLPPDDLLSPEAVRDPQSFFRRLREHDPVFWSNRHKVWILTGYHDVDRIFQDRSMSTAQGIGSFRKRMMAEHAELLKRAMSLLDGWMLFNDPPTHTRLRDPVRRSFSPAMVERLVPRIERHVHTLLDELSGTCDLVAGFAQPLTAMVICDLLGVDLEERDFLRGWARDFGRLIYGASSRGEDYLTTVARALLQHPEQWTMLRDDPTLMPLAVEELLRFDGPSKTFIRVPVAPLEIGGHEIAAGQHLWLAILAADHDPAVFRDPERLDIRRSPNPHIAFGAGIHFCLGSALARAEARVAFGALLERFPRMRLVSSEHRWSPTVVDRSLLELPVLLD